MEPLFLGALAILGTGLVLSTAKGESNATKNESTSSDPFTRWDYIIRRNSKLYSVPWRWIKAIMVVESNLGQAKSVARGLATPEDEQGSKSSDGKSWGLMQLTIPTAQMFMPGVTSKDLNNPEVSIRLGTQYLAYLIKLKGIGNREAVFRSYNGGPGYLSTVAGVRDTPAYNTKVVSALQTILAKQPGNELEF